MSSRRDVGSIASSRARAPRLRCLYRTVGLACNRGSRTMRSTFLPGEGSSMTKPDFVVSGDGHLLEPVDLFKTRLPEHLRDRARSEEHTSELQSLMRISYAVFCWKKTKTHTQTIKK